MSNDGIVKEHPNYFDECPKAQPSPIACMLQLQEIWADHEHFDYVDVKSDVYIVKLRIPKPDDDPRSHTHSTKEARYRREVKRDVNPETGDVRWLLTPDELSGGSDVFYSWELKDQGKAEIQVGETASTPIRGVKLADVWLWTTDHAKFEEIKATAKTVDDAAAKAAALFETAQGG